MDLNNSFPNYHLNLNIDNERALYGLKHNTYDDNINSSFNKINNLQLFDEEINKYNFNMSPGIAKKRSSLDISYSIEQIFNENSNMNIDEEFHNDTFLKIGNEGQKYSIDPIKEIDWFDKDINESFFNENNYFFNNFIENSNSIDFQINSSTGNPSDLFKIDSLQEESELNNIRKNIMSLKQNKNLNNSVNKSDIMNANNNILRKQVFNVSNPNNFNNNFMNYNSSHFNNLIQNNPNLKLNSSNNFPHNFSSNYKQYNNTQNNITPTAFNFYNTSSSNVNMNLNQNQNNNCNNTLKSSTTNKNSNNNINQLVINLPQFNIPNPTNNINSSYKLNPIKESIINSNSKINSNSDQKLNRSTNSLSNSFSKRRGRKKILFEGFKTEIIDKAFLREFRIYLKKSKSLRNIFEDLKPEEKIFWNEFMQNSNPPFVFNTKENQKVEFKSFNKNYLKFIFSFSSSRNLYSIFIKEKGKEIIQSILNKKIKKIDKKMIMLYTFYGKNLHKLYFDECNFNELMFEELENQNEIIRNSMNNSICLGEEIIENNKVNTSI